MFFGFPYSAFDPQLSGGKGQTNDADASEKFVCPNSVMKAPGATLPRMFLSHVTTCESEGRDS